MLQELDARGNQAAAGGILQGQIRPVPERRGMHWIWWLVILMLTIIGVSVAAWFWHGQAKSPTMAAKSLTPIPEFSLKIAPDLNMVPLPDAKVDVSVSATDSNSASNRQGNILPSAVQHRADLVSVHSEVHAMTVSGTRQSDISPRHPSSKNAESELTSSPEQKAAFSTSSRIAATPTSEKAAMPAAAPKVTETNAPAILQKQFKEWTPQQQAENAYRRGASLAQQGKEAEAIGAFEQALQLDAQHAGARQALVALLIENRRQEEAIRRLREGLKTSPEQIGLAMILARLQVERGDLKAAIDTLQTFVGHAGDRADYHAFLAALLQRDARHKEAIDQYTQVLRKAPQNGIWWMGLGISLQAENRYAEAADAYARAKASTSLSPELRAFVDEKIAALQH
jgi:MSHA biogenesis protein MshN